MAEDYAPGALTALLDSSSEVHVENRRKRKKTTGEKTSAHSSLFEKNAVKNKVPELPLGETFIPSKRPKAKKNNEAKVLSANSNEQSSSQQRKRRKRLNEEKMTLEEKERTIFIGNVPISTTKKDIKKLFSKFGEIESLRIRSLIAANDKVSKKVAALRNEFSENMHSLHFYVKFKDSSSVEGALEMNGEKFGSHTLRVDRCIGRRDYDSKTSIFVGNLPLDAKEDDLSKHFAMAGEVFFVRIVRDRDNGSGKGFGFVGFKDSSAVAIALKMDGSLFQERELRVRSIQKKKRLMKSSSNSDIKKKKAAKPRKVISNKILSTKRTVLNSDKNSDDKQVKKKIRKVIKKRKNKKAKKTIMT